MHAIEVKIATAILKGAKVTDVSEINGFNEPFCHEVLHEYCHWANRKAYKELSALSDQHLPLLEQLIRCRDDFLPESNKGR
ncbi:hypothetical protein, partial [Sansalvadorimonas verongulae]|uniref:hypothetical protein n=1 Tax=Sansalvadorimonas verongulae TaxID=2172824 RepID=UPI001E3A39C8